MSIEAVSAPIALWLPLQAPEAQALSVDGARAPGGVSGRAHQAGWEVWVPSPNRLQSASGCVEWYKTARLLQSSGVQRD